VLHDRQSRVLGDRKEKRLANLQHNTSYRRVGKALLRNRNSLHIEVGVLHENMACPKSEAGGCAFSQSPLNFPSLSMYK
jgi:hypothetical protein